MAQQTQTRPLMRTILIGMIGLVGISIVIIIHELGHLLACKLFGIPAPLFSVGFGPRIVSFQWGQTVYQLAALPLGGFVQINEQSLMAAPYPHVFLIITAGIICNIVLAYAILFYLALRTRCPADQNGPCQAQQTLRNKFRMFMKSEGLTRGFIGPIGIIGMLGKSIFVSWRVFLLVMALLSVNVGLFNLLPLPFLDGGKLLLITMQRFVGARPHIIRIVYLVLMALLLALLIRRRQS